MKTKILHAIYQIFEDWAQKTGPACTKGCASCCTRNVNITALEGQEILEFIIEEGREAWIGEKLGANAPLTRPAATTNSFALACFENRELDIEPEPDLGPCPFLEENCCQIYPVRPFACRMFLSSTTCSSSQPAQVPVHFTEAASAVSQLVEHLGQKEYWGNMLDVLPAMLDISAYSEIGRKVDSARILSSRVATLTARPLPGFLISPESEPEVSPLLENIFATRIDSISIEDYLNGRR